jgi:hypothetical protein
MLANVDHQRDFQSLMGRANRANVSIYPIDPRGLAAPARVEGQDALEHRRSTMRDLATSTDGFTVIDTNDFDRGVKRIVDDMSSYYLLGYYSTNAKLDGRFRKITVRVKRPGVAVRARNGYQAPTEAELAPPPSASGASKTPGPRDARGEAVAGALALLNRMDAGSEPPKDAAWKAFGDAERALGRPRVFKRSQSTGPAFMPTTDPRFRRTDRVRVDLQTVVPLDALAATLLDRFGKPLPMPVTLGEREENGVRYVTGELVLAPLAVGDYVVEITHRASSPPASVLIAFRIVP